MRLPREDGVFRLLAAHGISTLGTSMSFLAIPWFVLVTTGSATTTGLVALAEMLPYVLVQALAGPLVDRTGPWRASIVTDLVAASAMGLVPVGHALHVLSLPLLAAAVATAGAFRGAGDIARRVMLPRVAKPAGLPLERASGLFDGAGRLAGLIGSPLAGVLIASASAPAVLAIDAGTFLFSALMIATGFPRKLPCPHGAPSGSAHASYGADLREGIRYLRKDRLLLGIVAMIIVTNLLDQAYASVLLPVWVRQELGTPIALGTVAGCFGIGAVAGNAFMAWAAPKLPRRLPFAIGFLVCGAPRFVVLALAGHLSPVLAVALCSGFGAGGINPALGAVGYERVPPELQARVLGAVAALAWAGIPFGGLLGGGLVDAFGLRASLALCGLAYLLATLAPFVLPAWRQMERPPSGDPGSLTAST